MNDYQIQAAITKLADNELQDEEVRDKIISLVSLSPELSFCLDVQVLVSKNLKESIIKYPVPHDLQKKLLNILSSKEV